MIKQKEELHADHPSWSPTESTNPKRRKQMKIPFTIIKDGISRGIPEGTKVPEKRHNTGPSVCACQDCMDYMYAFAASIEWEDQIEVAEKLPQSTAFEPKPDKPGKFKLKDGIYPLEGVEAEKVEQAWFVFRDEWVDKCYAEMGKGYYSTDFRWRTVLRLTPQHNSEHHTNHSCPSDIEAEKKHVICTNDACHGECGECNYMKVEGSEVSEPTQNVVLDLVSHPPKSSPAVKFKVGGVSEEEPTQLTQDELWSEIGEIFAEPMDTSLPLGVVKGLVTSRLMKLYHIQKLKP